MSDQNLVPIESDTLLAYLKAKDVIAKCPHCPKVDWQVLESESGRGFWVSMLGDDGQDNGSKLPILPLVCKNCGYLWPIARQQVQEWMEESGGSADVQ